MSDLLRPLGTEPSPIPKSDRPTWAEAKDAAERLLNRPPPDDSYLRDAGIVQVWISWTGPSGRSP